MLQVVLVILDRPGYHGASARDATVACDQISWYLLSQHVPDELDLILTTKTDQNVNYLPQNAVVTLKKM